MGGTSTPPDTASKASRQSSRYLQGSSPPQPSSGACDRLALSRASPRGWTSMAPDLKKSEKMTIFCQPRCRAASSASAGPSGSSRAWKIRGRGSSRMMAGGSRGMEMRRSVTSSSLRRGTRKTASQKAPVAGSLPTGPRTWCLNSSPQGMGEPSVGSTCVRAGKPRRGSGRFSGTANWPGATQTSASGSRCANGPAAVLCSTATVGSTRYLTGPCSSSSSFSSRMHSSVGATAP
mmetsp:Transcript_3690/g.11609  ORF Transcript_3690/g.11609 Transcript_3690/m.11609 type:complete len:234 (-) Transcript_3690:212-913(-)